MRILRELETLQIIEDGGRYYLVNKVTEKRMSISRELALSMAEKPALKRVK